ncbi:MAG TPA: hypothetical protein VIB39_19795 [Candidatus Angelobacter sp.]|jgi:hypothetical protein
MSTFMPPPYAPEIIRDGSHLFIALPPQGQVVNLPPVCVKCGQPATGKPVVKTYSWHHPGFYLLILIALLIYVIVALIVRKTVRVGVYLCPQHAQRRSLWLTLAWVLPLVGIVDGFVLPQVGVDTGWTVLLSIALVLSGLVIWAVAGYPIRARSIDAFRAEFSGFCESFLEQFPINTRF